jgi:hypothetical protein
VNGKPTVKRILQADLSPSLRARLAIDPKEKASQGVSRRPRQDNERIPQKLTGFCDENSLKLFKLARFLVPRTIPFEGQARLSLSASSTNRAPFGKP